MRGSARAVTLVLLVVWVLLGPLAMAFDGCAASGGCDGTCATSPSPGPTADDALLVMVESLVPRAPEPVAAATPRVPDVPPKSLLTA